jgi:uncharacterized protein (TIGR03067 family)
VEPKRSQAAVYSLEGDTLKICFGTGGKEAPRRPKEVASKEGSQTLLYTLKRMKPDGDKPGKEKSRNDKEALQGVWQVDTVVEGGKDTSDKWPQDMREWVVTDNGFVLLRAKGAGEVGYYVLLGTLDPDRKPKEIDLLPITISGPAERYPNPGVYSLDGDVWKVCFPREANLGSASGKALDRPNEVASTQANGALLITLKRVQPNQDKPKDPKSDKQALQGVWRVGSVQVAG